MRLARLDAAACKALEEFLQYLRLEVGKGRWKVAVEVGGTVSLLNLNCDFLEAGFLQNAGEVCDGQGAGDAAGPTQSGPNLILANRQTVKIAIDDNIRPNSVRPESDPR